MNDLCVSLGQLGFALDDVKLFLDINPDDASALALYHELMSMRDIVMEQFIETIGPVSAYDVPEGQGWSWVNGPWPWQMGGC